MSAIRHRAPSPPAGQVEKDQLIRDAEEKELVEGQKFIIPNFTVKQLLDAIPVHCFHRSALRSSLYIVQDVTVIAALVYGALHIDSSLLYFNLSSVSYHLVRIGLYVLYAFVTGLFGTGIWVIAHEAGHQSFSSSKRINNFVGWVLHSALLVPYHSWRISHAQHHAATGHLTRDQVFVPRTRKELGFTEAQDDSELNGINVAASRQAEFREALEDSPVAIFWHLFLHQIFGWPLYLARNAAGQGHYPRYTNHFTPSSIIFKSRDKWQIIMSDVGVTIALALLALWGYKRTFTEVAVIYGVPYLWVNHWLVMITFLQHTDPILPHYSANKWTFARGALATIDRTFLGPIGAYVLHGICETHVAHHVSSKMPHYNAWEATAALKEFLGSHYYRNDENVLYAFYKNYRDCKFIEDSQDVVFYKNAAGVAQRVPVEEGGHLSDSGIDMSEMQ